MTSVYQALVGEEPGPPRKARARLSSSSGAVGSSVGGRGRPPRGLWAVVRRGGADQGGMISAELAHCPSRRQGGAAMAGDRTGAVSRPGPSEAIAQSGAVRRLLAALLPT